jgi:N-methylhydantoinase A
LTKSPDLPKLEKAEGAAKPRGSRPVIFDDGTHDTAIYDRSELLAGHAFVGPAVVEEPASVTVVRPGDAVRVDDYGHLLIGRIAAATD